MARSGCRALCRAGAEVAQKPRCGPAPGEAEPAGVAATSVTGPRVIAIAIPTLRGCCAHVPCETQVDVGAGTCERRDSSSENQAVDELGMAVALLQVRPERWRRDPPGGREFVAIPSHDQAALWGQDPRPAATNEQVVAEMVDTHASREVEQFGRRSTMRRAASASSTAPHSPDRSAHATTESKRRGPRDGVARPSMEEQDERFFAMDRAVVPIPHERRAGRTAHSLRRCPNCSGTTIVRQPRSRAGRSRPRGVPGGHGPPSDAQRRAGRASALRSPPEQVPPRGDGNSGGMRIGRRPTRRRHARHVAPATISSRQRRALTVQGLRAARRQLVGLPRASASIAAEPAEQRDCAAHPARRATAPGRVRRCSSSEAPARWGERRGRQQRRTEAEARSAGPSLSACMNTSESPCRGVQVPWRCRCPAGARRELEVVGGNACSSG